MSLPTPEAAKGGKLTFGSVCSGIEAASVAWNPLGFRASWFAEIEPFCCSLLKHHYPETHNYGNFTSIPADAPAIDVLVGGTPCQSFSIAGLRGGLDDDRGNLALEFCRLADRLRPRWFVWENVPGVLSSNGGRDFGSILGAMGELGYGTAYRILDAQYFGVPQRRRRVFVVGHLGNWRLAAAVLFERFSLSGNSAPRRETREDVAPTISARTKGGGGLGTDFDCDGGLICPTLRAGGNKTGGHRPPGTDVDTCDSLIALPIQSSSGKRGYGVEENCIFQVVGTLPSGGTPNGHGTAGVNDQAVMAGHVIPILEAGARTGTSTTDPRAGIGIGEADDPMFTLQSGKQHAIGFYANDGNHPAVAIPFDTTQITSVANYSNPKPGDPCHPLASGAHPPAVAISGPARGDDGRGYSRVEHISDVAGSLDTVKPDRIFTPGMAVRRLTPMECERLQGFPDRYTAIPHRGKPAADGPRYKALGNSMAVPCMEYIGRRILAVERLFA